MHREARGKARNLEPRHTAANGWGGVRRVRPQPVSYSRTRRAVPMRRALSHPCASACICGSKLLASTRDAPGRQGPRAQRTSRKPMHQNRAPRPAPTASGHGKTPCTNSPNPGATGVGEHLCRTGGKTPCTYSSACRRSADRAGRRPTLSTGCQNPMHQFRPNLRQDETDRGRQNPVHHEQLPYRRYRRLAQRKMRRW